MRGRKVGAEVEIFREDTNEFIGLIKHVPQTGYALNFGPGWWHVFYQIWTPDHEENILNQKLLLQEATNLRGIYPNG